MKVTIVGGGPGGLYFAILAKKAWPDWNITVYERNRAGDTFGFGVVFSDETLRGRGVLICVGHGAGTTQPPSAHGTDRQCTLWPWCDAAFGWDTTVLIAQ